MNRVPMPWTDIPDRDNYVARLKADAIADTMSFTTDDIDASTLLTLKGLVCSAIETSNGVDLHEYGHPRMFMVELCYLEGVSRYSAIPKTRMASGIARRVNRGAKLMLATDDWDDLADLVNISKVLAAFA